MSVIAKFYVSGLGSEENLGVYNPGTLYKVRLSPVGSGSEENKMFFKWTPSGEISLTTKKREFAERFRASKEWYVTFEEVERAIAPADECLFTVRVLGNESSSETERLYRVELRGENHGPLAEAWGSEIKLGTINAAAAKEFLGMGHFLVKFTPAPAPA